MAKNKLSIHAFARMLSGRQYGNEISKVEEKTAKEQGLLVIFGASDDLVELRGAIHEEVSAYNGTSFRLENDGLVMPHECDCEFCTFDPDDGAEIKVLWDEGEYSWMFETEIPHATFEIVEGEEKYCQGIVLEMKSVR
jgi:hypothetical protein